VMPPFMGEGMCTGIRDANNLAWKLDLVLRGLSPQTLLETYTPERLPFVHHAVHVSVEMGKVSCLLDPMAAAGRDEAMRAAAGAPPPPPPRLDGPLSNANRDDPLAGTLSVQGTLRGTDGATRRADELFPGFVLLLRTGSGADSAGVSDQATLDWFASIGGHVATLDPESDGRLDDADGRLTGWLDDHGAAAVLYRPDQYVFGSVDLLTAVAALLEQLRTALT
jgi:hypothetical protein